MGVEIDRTTFSDEDYRRFGTALENNLHTLQSLLHAPGFGRGAASLGAELEMYIIDQQGRPLHANQEIAAAAQDPQLTLELNRYNLEYNLSPYLISERAFIATEREIEAKLASVRAVARKFGGRIVPIGILPTLLQSDFGPHCITDRKRFHALVQQLLARRGGNFSIDINGESPLQLEMSDITLEGANTSFQIHYRVAVEDFAQMFNAIQLVTPLVLALGANSPTLFGHRLWHETRIPLFKQAIDTRTIHRYSWNQPPRVSFGQGWVREGAAELFAEVVRLYPPLLPVCAPPAQGEGGGAPALAELRLHQSTVWLWNRPIYDDADGGHLRIEMRALPAGPTSIDMVANAALLIGLAQGMRPELDQLLPALPFAIAEYNFYRAAQAGLEARLVWPCAGQPGFHERPVFDIVRDLLPTAERGLDAIGVTASEAQRYLDVIRARIQRAQNGATWQRAALAALERNQPQEVAQREMLEAFYAHSLTNQPVAEWPL
jgi:gamma-glutamyl:cysteine ligase YbdK (ATP-grasp superfamily)